MIVVASGRSVVVAWSRATKTYDVRELDRVNLTPYISACPACGGGPDAH